MAWCTSPRLSEDHVDKIKNVLKVGQEVEARVIKVDKVERRIGLSIKAANYSEEQLKREAEAFDTLKPGEDMVGLGKSLRRRRTGRVSPRRFQRRNQRNPRARVEKGLEEEIGPGTLRVSSRTGLRGNKVYCATGTPWRKCVSWNRGR